MPRTRKVEIGHEETVPLSLPEVQLATANSIHGDEVDQRAVHMAVQGYQLLLQGTLRNSHSEVTRELQGHTGYYRNLMRGVAQVFGLENKDTVDSEIIKIESSSESSDFEQAETSEDDIEIRKPKRRKLETTGGSETHSTQKPGPPSVIAGISAEKKVSESQQMLPETEPAERKMSESQQVLPDTEQKQSTPLRTFNRYKRTQASSSLRQAPTKEKETVRETTKETDSGQDLGTAAASDEVTEDGSILHRAETASKQGIDDDICDMKEKESGTAGTSIEEENVQRCDLTSRETDQEPTNSTPLLTKRNSKTRSEDKTRASPHKLKSEDVQGILESLDVPAHFTLLSDSSALRTLEKGLLPGTWMFNRKSLTDVDFLAPEESENYFMVRCIDSHSCPFPTDEDQWQVILIKDLKTHCASVNKREEKEVSSRKFSVFVFDSSKVGLQNSLFVGIWNFINGVLRASYYNKHKLKNPKRADAQMLKLVLTTVSTNIVRVCMPIQPRLGDSGMYMLANIFHLSKENNVEVILDRMNERDVIEETTLCLGFGKKKTVIPVSLREIRAENSYDDSFVEPMFAL